MISIRDLAVFSSSAVTIWPLLGAQIKRVSTGFASTTRTQYYKLVLELILQQKRIQNEPFIVSYVERVLDCHEILYISSGRNFDAIDVSLKGKMKTDSSEFHIRMRFSNDGAYVEPFEGREFRIPVTGYQMSK